MKNEKIKIAINVQTEREKEREKSLPEATESSSLLEGKCGAVAVTFVSEGFVWSRGFNVDLKKSKVILRTRFIS